MNIKIHKNQYKQIFSLYESGLSQREISDIFQVSTACIETIFKKQGFKTFAWFFNSCCKNPRNLPSKAIY